jgi:hypothetical protein
MELVTFLKKGLKVKIADCLFFEADVPLFDGNRNKGFGEHSRGWEVGGNFLELGSDREQRE